MPSPLDILANITCGSVLASRAVPRDPVIISATESLSKACQILANAAVTSAPVFSQTDHSFVGFLDCMDILQLIVKQHEQNFLDPWLDTLLAHQNIMDATSAQVAALSPDRQFDSVGEDTTLDVVCRMLIGDKNELRIRHRLPVKDRNGNFIAIISQSDIIKVLYHHRSELALIMNKKITLLHLGLQGEHNLVTCDAENPLISCLQIMVQKQVNSIGLVDDENHILMVFSLSDTKHLLLLPNAEALRNALERSVGDFKSDLIRSNISTKDSKPVFVVTPEATLNEIIGKIVATHAHRVYVCKDHIAQGLISITDILRVFCREVQ